MAKDELRVAGILTVCAVAGLAGVVWGQVIQPPAYEENSREAEEQARAAEELLSECQMINEEDESVCEFLREYSVEQEAEARKFEEPAGD
ncbi:MAG: hypothetical protein ACIAS6_10200 [Phycisphaerales bacterium JB060]